ncbi:uncharacterized protein V6R79_015308 [Siganus canaliculatus]
MAGRHVEAIETWSASEHGSPKTEPQIFKVQLIVKAFGRMGLFDNNLQHQKSNSFITKQSECVDPLTSGSRKKPAKSSSGPSQAHRSRCGRIPQAAASQIQLHKAPKVLWAIVNDMKTVAGLHKPNNKNPFLADICNVFRIPQTKSVLARVTRKENKANECDCLQWRLRHQTLLQLEIFTLGCENRIRRVLGSSEQEQHQCVQVQNL